MTDSSPPASPGRASVAPVVLVPGIGMSHRYNARLRRALGEGGTRVLSFDLPGFAGRRRPGDLLPVRGFAEVVGSALDARGVRGAVLAGHSMGAQVAAEVARIRPDLVSRLVLMAPVVDPARRTARQQTVDLLRDVVVETPSSTAVIATDFLRTDPRWFFGELRRMLDYDVRATVASLDCPVLVLRGERDPVARRPWCELLAGAAADGRFTEVPRAGHIVQYAEARAVAERILEFAADS